MASINAMACSASTLVSNNKMLGSPAQLGLGMTPSLKTSSSRSSGLMVKAQQAGSPRKIDPVAAEQFHKKVALLETSPYGKYSLILLSFHNIQSVKFNRKFMG